MQRPGRGIVFDFDGTIALSEHVHMEAWDDIAAEYEKALPAGFHEKGVGQTDDLLARDLSAAWLGEPEPTALLAKKRRYYQQKCRTKAVLVPGIVEFLTHCHRRAPIGLATSASLADITPTLEIYGLARFFDVILTVESVRYPKPHPEIYLTAAARLGFDPLHGIVFEDSPTGAAAARAAGMQVVGLTTTFGVEAIGPVVAGMADYHDLATLERLIFG